MECRFDGGFLPAYKHVPKVYGNPDEDTGMLRWLPELYIQQQQALFPVPGCRACKETIRWCFDSRIY